ncbi:MAG: hypothetical protein JWO05_570 [Gemmatimonadetes bacterium]|nr:hypothetical protein [Gemmatimonadota bacterium]
MAIGVGTTLLFAKGENGRRPISPLLSGVGRGAKWAGRGIRHGAGRVREEGGELLDRIPIERMEHALSETFSEAQERVDEAVRGEVHALRKAIRRQRQRLGL